MAAIPDFDEWSKRPENYRHVADAMKRLEKLVYSEWHSEPHPDEMRFCVVCHKDTPHDDDIDGGPLYCVLCYLAKQKTERLRDLWAELYHVKRSYDEKQEAKQRMDLDDDMEVEEQDEQQQRDKTFDRIQDDRDPSRLKRPRPISPELP